MTRPAAMTSRSVRVKSTRRLTQRAYRVSDRLFLAEGPQAVREALRRPGCVVEVFATAAATARHSDLEQSASQTTVDWHLADDGALESLTEARSPQGLVAVCRCLDVSLRDLEWQHVRLVCVCANVRDPGNAGTVIRCADAAGADAVVLAGTSVDPYNPKAVRASAGSLFHQPLVAAPSVEDTVGTLRRHGLVVLAADGAGDLSLEELDAESLRRPTAWLFGNEAWGLPADVIALADQVVRVPIYGAAESLNLATAAALCLYASAREQRQVTHGDGRTHQA
jgi:TrmH family RNA methyltransferase